MPRPVRDPRERIVVVPLAHGVRVDAIAALPGFPEHRSQPVHFRTMAEAEAFAERLAAIFRNPIIRAGEPGA